MGLIQNISSVLSGKGLTGDPKTSIPGLGGGGFTGSKETSILPWQKKVPSTQEIKAKKYEESQPSQLMPEGLGKEVSNYLEYKYGDTKGKTQVEPGQAQPRTAEGRIISEGQGKQSDIGNYLTPTNILLGVSLGIIAYKLL